MGKNNSEKSRRNEARKQFRKENPQHRGKKLKKWPIEANFDGLANNSSANAVNAVNVVNAVNAVNDGENGDVANPD